MPDVQTCTQCWEGFELSNGACVENEVTGPCPKSYFRNSDGECDVCAAGCATCTGPTAADCTSCVDSGDWKIADNQDCTMKCDYSCADSSALTYACDEQEVKVEACTNGFYLDGFTGNCMQVPP